MPLERRDEEIGEVNDGQQTMWNDILDPALGREQHDAVADLYSRLGVQVTDLQEQTIWNAFPNLYFVCDLYSMTPQGAILARPASAVRAGEECIVARTLASIGVPILYSINRSDRFEGPDLVLVNESVAFLGYGLRSNYGAALQIRELLKNMGFDVYLIQSTYGCGHLDGVMNIVGPNTAVLYPTRVSYVVFEVLQRHGFSIIDLPDPQEAEIGMAINMVSVAPDCVVIPAGNPRTKKTLEAANIHCYEVDVSELMKGGGAVHCMTGVLWRDKE